MKALRNRTIDVTVEEEKKYLDRVINISDSPFVEDIKDKTILGDTLDVLSKLPDNFVDLLVVDPPYNLDKDFNGNKFRKTTESLYEEYTDEWISACLHILKPTASVYVCCDWLCSNSIYNVLKKYFYIQNRITWQREKGRGALSNWKNGMEDIWFATVSNDYTFNVEDVKLRRRVLASYKVDGKPKDWEETEDGKFRNTYPSNFWDDISIPYWSMPENTVHPTQKPEKLIAKLVLASSNKGDFVFDAFLGSGTTSVTAKKLDRHYCGIEQNEKYCILAEKRLEMVETDKTIQGYADGVFWERHTNIVNNHLQEQKEEQTRQNLLKRKLF